MVVPKRVKNHIDISQLKHNLYQQVATYKLQYNITFIADYKVLIVWFGRGSPGRPGPVCYGTILMVQNDEVPLIPN